MEKEREKERGGVSFFFSVDVNARPLPPSIDGSFSLSFFFPFLPLQRNPHLLLGLLLGRLLSLFLLVVLGRHRRSEDDLSKVGQKKEERKKKKNDEAIERKKKRRDSFSSFFSRVFQE